MPPSPAPTRLGRLLVGLVVAALAAACSSGSSGSSGTSAAPGSDRTATGTGSTGTGSPGAGSGRAAKGTAGCGTPLPSDLHGPAGQDADVVRTLGSGGATRSYRLGVPRDSTNRKPQPLVLNFHGSGSNALEQSAYSQLPDRGERRGYVVVTPDAIGGQWQLFPTDGSGGTDLAFAQTLIAEVERHLCIDTTRVFADGISLGSAFATDLACTLPTRIAAVGLVAEEVVFPPCDRALPVIAFHGTADPVVPYEEGDLPAGQPNAGLPGTEHNMARWAELAHCSPTPQITRIGTEVDHWVWSGCAPGSAVQLYSIQGGGHTWPGSPVKVDRLGHTTDQVDATALVLDFFDAHPLR